METWGANTTVHDIMVRSDKINEVSDILGSNNATFQIVIKDIQRAIQEENPEISEEHEIRHKRNYFYFVIIFLYLILLCLYIFLLKIICF